MLETGLTLITLMTAATVLGLAYSVDPDAVIVEPIQVPLPLEEMGLSSIVVSDRVAAEMHRIHDLTETNEQGRGVGLGGEKNIVAALEEELNVSGPVWIVRKQLGIEQYKIQGEIVAWGDELEFRLRGHPPGGRMKVAVERGTLENFERLISKAAEEVFRMVDPYVLAAYYYHREEHEGDFTETLGAIQAGMDPDQADIHQAHNLKRLHNPWARVLIADYDYDGAIAKLEMALALDPSYAAAYQTWGEVLHAQARYREAIEMCRRAVELDPNLHGAYSMWGNALTALGYEDEGERARAISEALNPNNAHAYFERGDLYYRLGRYEAALREYERGIAIDPLDDRHDYNVAKTRTRLGLAELEKFHAYRGM